MNLITLLLNMQIPILLILMSTFCGCKTNSETTIDKTAGLNGSFEFAKNDYPINWVIYSPKTVPAADFKVLLDTKNFKDGKQSLKFEVNKCSSIGGRQSPGFTNEFFEIGKFEGEGKYKITFWVMNHGAKFRMMASGVSAQKGEMKILIEENKNIEEWKQFEYEVEVKKNNWLRIELNILQAGEFWIDAITIDKIA